MQRAADVLLGIVLVIGVSQPAHAYLDPTNGSMLMQALMGGFAGLAVLGRLALRQVLDRMFGGRRTNGR
jgi:hypothetical protein